MERLIMKKSKIILFVLLIILLIFVILFFDYILSDRNIINGYFKSETYGDKYGFQHYLEYYKYYYKPEKDTDFYTLYNKVNNENINEIKLYYNDFKERMNNQNRLNDYDFNDNSIDENDYFLLFDKNNRDFGKKYAKFFYYTLYFYDTNSHILYVLHCN